MKTSRLKSIKKTLFGLAIIVFLKILYDFSKSDEDFPAFGVILLSSFFDTFFNKEIRQNQDRSSSLTSPLIEKSEKYSQAIQELGDKYSIYFEKFPDEREEAKNFISNVYEGISTFYSVYNNTRLEAVEAFVFFEDHSIYERNINSLFLSALATINDFYFFESVQSRKKMNCSNSLEGYVINPLHTCYGWDDEWALAKTKILVQKKYANNLTKAMTDPEIAEECITVRNRKLIETDKVFARFFSHPVSRKRFYTVGTNHFLPERSHQKLKHAEAVGSSRGIRASYEDIDPNDRQNELRNYFSQNTRYAFLNLKSRVHWPPLLSKEHSKEYGYAR